MKFEKLNPFGIRLNSLCTPHSMRPLINEHRLVVVRGAKSLSRSDLISYSMNLSQKVGDIKEKLLHWEFGPVMEMRFDSSAKNYLFSEEKVPLHWDGAFHKEPSVLVFYCEDSLGEGGETLFCDTTLISALLSEADLSKARKIELHYSTKKLAHYGGSIQVSLVQNHPETNTPILRLAEEVNSQLNPVKRRVLGDKDNIIPKIETLFPKCTYEHSWEKGDLVFADNFSLLHGRRELNKNLVRKFSRLQVL